MFNEQENLELVKKLFVNNGEYKFKNEQQANRFARDLLGRIESNYSDEGYYHKYDELSDFIRSHHADSTAYFLYQDDYEEQEA